MSFETEVELSVTVPERELRSARSQIEDGIGDVEVGVGGRSSASQAMTDGGRQGRRMFRWARQRTEDISDILDILEDIEEDLEDGGGGGGDGLFPRGLRGLSFGGLLGGGLGGLALAGATVTAAALIADKAIVTAQDVIKRATEIEAADVIDAGATVAAAPLIATAAAIKAADVIASKANINPSDVVDSGAEITAGALIASPLTQLAVTASEVVIDQATPEPSPTDQSTANPQDVLKDRVRQGDPNPFTPRDERNFQTTPTGQETTVGAKGTSATGFNALGILATIGSVAGGASLAGGSAIGRAIGGLGGGAATTGAAAASNGNVTVNQGDTNVTVEASPDELVNEATEQAERERQKDLDELRRQLERALAGSGGVGSP